MVASVGIVLVSSVLICAASPVEKLVAPKISIPEVYIPVHIQPYDAAEESPMTSSSTTTPVSTSTPSEPCNSTSDDGHKHGANDDVNVEAEAATTNVPSDEFPTPLPFLDEPEEVIKAFPSSPSRGTNVPPNFDISRVPGITGMREGQITPTYVGRQACRCGVAGDRRFSSNANDTKIVGGEPAPIEEYPWTAALLRRNWLGVVNSRPYCGGTLINNLYILTASHCVDGMSARSIVVALHEEDVTSQSETNAGVTRFEVERITMHPNYNRRTIDHDVALVKLKSPVTLNTVFIPACLPANNDHTFENFTATAAGWGATKESGSTSNVLRKVDVPVMSNEECNTKTKYKGKITDNMLCSGYEEGGKDSCQGDSGGPLTIENGERRTLIGIVSWGYGCARPNSPGVYTRVARYPEWIVANSKDAEWCLE